MPGVRPILLALALVSACSARPLTPAETAFAASVQGPALDPAPVRIVTGSALSAVSVVIPPRPRTTCRELVYPPQDAPALGFYPAFALGNLLFYDHDLATPDLMAGWPHVLPLEDAMRLAHELTHVWQWQNRRATGYTPWSAALEHRGTPDPYLFTDRPGAQFADYGWEQQGALVEEFVCCRALDPDGARTRRLTALLSDPFPGLSPREAAPRARLPWDRAETSGICSQNASRR